MYLSGQNFTNHLVYINLHTIIRCSVLVQELTQCQLFRNMPSCISIIKIDPAVIFEVKEVNERNRALYSSEEVFVVCGILRGKVAET